MTQIINHRWLQPTPSRKKILLHVDRHTLAKRRWQAAATDGAAFGFDLKTPLRDGDVIFESETEQYVLAQKPEVILEVALGTPEKAARIAWSLGNLHFAIEVSPYAIRIIDDPAVRIYLERDHIDFVSTTGVFHPLKAIAHEHSHVH